MQEMLLAIWHQDFEQLLALEAVGLLIGTLVVILLLESSLVFMPLPGDGLLLLAYLQGRALQGSVAMGYLQRIVPPQSLPRAADLLARHGFLALFSSRFLPFVRVLTPMLMGMGRLPPLRMAMVSFGSAFLWCLLLSLVGKGMESIPLFMRHQQQITQLLLMSSVLLFLVAVVTLGVRFARSGAQRRRL